MQVGTLSAIAKVVFAVAVIAILVYIVVRSPPVKLGRWRIDGSSDDMLKFISPANDVVLGVSQSNKGIVIKNYLVKSDENGLQVFDPNLEQITQFSKGEIKFGHTILADNMKSTDPDTRGLRIAEDTSANAVATLGSDRVNFPQKQVLLKVAQSSFGGGFQVYDTKAKNIVVEFPKQSIAAQYNII